MQPLLDISGGQRRAFSLVELLVSMVILTILVVLFAQVVNQASTAWRMGQANMERLQNVRAVTDFIGNELQAALLPICQSGTNSLQFVVNPATLTSGSYNRDTIFWQTPLATDQTLGDVAEIGYFVKWDTTIATNPRAQLRRFFVNPGSATPSGTAISDTNYLIYSQPNKWITDDIANKVAPANKPSYQGLFAENVIGIWVQCLDPYGQLITKDASGVAFSGNSFDSRRGYSYIDPNNPAAPPIIKSACSLPSAIDIGLVMLDSRSANRIGSQQQTDINTILTSGTSCPNASAFVEKAKAIPSLQSIRPSLRYYQTRIYLQNSK